MEEYISIVVSLPIELKQLVIAYTLELIPIYPLKRDDGNEGISFFNESVWKEFGDVFKFVSQRSKPLLHLEVNKYGNLSVTFKIRSDMSINFEGDLFTLTDVHDLNFFGFHLESLKVDEKAFSNYKVRPLVEESLNALVLGLNPDRYQFTLTPTNPPSVSARQWSNSITHISLSYDFITMLGDFTSLQEVSIQIFEDFLGLENIGVLLDTTSIKSINLVASSTTFTDIEDFLILLEEYKERVHFKTYELIYHLIRPEIKYKIPSSQIEFTALDLVFVPALGLEMNAFFDISRNLMTPLFFENFRHLMIYADSLEGAVLKHKRITMLGLFCQSVKKCSFKGLVNLRRISLGMEHEPLTMDSCTFNSFQNSVTGIDINCDIIAKDLNAFQFPKYISTFKCLGPEVLSQFNFDNYDHLQEISFTSMNGITERDECWNLIPKGVTSLHFEFKDDRAATTTITSRNSNTNNNTHNKIGGITLPNHLFPCFKNENNNNNNNSKPIDSKLEIEQVELSISLKFPSRQGTQFNMIYVNVPNEPAWVNKVKNPMEFELFKVPSHKYINLNIPGAISGVATQPSSINDNLTDTFASSKSNTDNSKRIILHFIIGSKGEHFVFYPDSDETSLQNDAKAGDYGTGFNISCSNIDTGIEYMVHKGMNDGVSFLTKYKNIANSQLI